jgi:hypothetical protein
MAPEKLQGQCHRKYINGIAESFQIMTFKRKALLQKA